MSKWRGSFNTVMRSITATSTPTMSNPKYAAYEAANPYFELVRGALGDLVYGEHFFDIVAEDVVYEVLYDVAGWPRTIQGRADLMGPVQGLLRQHRASICR